MIFTKTNVVNQSTNGSDGNITVSGGSGSYKHPTGWLWGNKYTGKETIDGDITSKGTVKAENGDFGNVEATNITGNEGTFEHLVSTEIEADSVEADLVDAERGEFGELEVEELQAENAVIKDLTVTGLAHFFTLMIDKVRAVGGRIILSSASCNIKTIGTNYEYTQNPDGSWSLDDGGEVYTKRVYFGEKQTDNEFAYGDLVICQRMEANSGTYQNVSNTYYKTTIVGTGFDDSRTASHGKCWVDLFFSTPSTTEFIKDATVTPHVGDTLVQIGNIKDEDRQNFIVMSAYDNAWIDTSIDAPCIVQYKGVDSFSLTGKDMTVISPTKNKFSGDFLVTTGKTIEQYVNDKIADSNPTINTWYAYNTTASDSGCSQTDSDSMTYIGIKISSETTWSNTGYKWMLKGEKTSFYQWVTTNKTFTVDKDKNYNINVTGVIYFFDGSEVTKCTSLPSGYMAGYNLSGASIMPSPTPSVMTLSSGVFKMTSSGNNTLYTKLIFGLYKISTNSKGLMTYSPFDVDSVDAYMLPSSIFSMTNEQIKLQVLDGLGATGIDISNHKITANADNFEIKSVDGEKTFMQVDDFGITADNLMLGDDCYVEEKIVIGKLFEYVTCSSGSVPSYYFKSDGGVYERFDYEELVDVYGDYYKDSTNATADNPSEIENVEANSVIYPEYVISNNQWYKKTTKSESIEIGFSPNNSYMPFIKVNGSTKTGIKSDGLRVIDGIYDLDSDYRYYYDQPTVHVGNKEVSICTGWNGSAPKERFRILSKNGVLYLAYVSTSNTTGDQLIEMSEVWKFLWNNVSNGKSTQTNFD